MSDTLNYLNKIDLTKDNQLLLRQRDTGIHFKLDYTLGTGVISGKDITIHFDNKQPVLNLFKVPINSDGSLFYIKPFNLEFSCKGVYGFSGGDYPTVISDFFKLSFFGYYASDINGVLHNNFAYYTRIEKYSSYPSAGTSPLFLVVRADVDEHCLHIGVEIPISDVYVRYVYFNAKIDGLMIDDYEQQEFPLNCLIESGDDYTKISPSSIGAPDVPVFIQSGVLTPTSLLKASIVTNIPATLDSNTVYFMKVI